MTTRAELAQDLYSQLVAFVEKKLAGKEAILNKTQLGGYVERMRNMDLATAGFLAQAGFMSWAAIQPRLIEPMKRMGVVLTKEEEDFVAESLDAITALLARQ